MLITAMAFTGTARIRDYWPVYMQYIVGPLIVVSVRRFLACPLPAAMVILATRSSAVSTTVSYISCLMCPQRKKSRRVRSGDLVYETVVETENNLFARITVAAGTIADMPGIFERTRQSIVRRCTACIQANGGAFEQYL